MRTLQRLLRPAAASCRARPAAPMRAFAGDAASELRRTPLYTLNTELGGTMVEFGGWAMPVKYAGKEGGIMHSHLHTRSAAGLFDVSHMVPLRFHGADRAAFMETFLLGDILELPEGMGTLSSIPNDAGGLIDDCICTNAGDHMYLVINAGHEDKDLPHIQAKLDEFVGAGGDVSMELAGGGGLLALQGPSAVDVLARLCPDVDFAQMAFMSGRKLDIDGRECFVTRSGYTGEDGFEIGVGEAEAESLATQLLEQPEVLPVGLGARDSLRLEAGLCLYGNDLDDTTTPAEAVLMWTVGKRRRAEGGFPGHEVIMQQFKEKSAARCAPYPHFPTTLARRAPDPLIACLVPQEAGRLRVRSGRWQARPPGARGLPDLHRRGRAGWHRHLRRPIALPQEADRHGLRSVAVPARGERAACRGRREEAAADGHEDALHSAGLLQRTGMKARHNTLSDSTISPPSIRPRATVSLRLAPPLAQGGHGNATPSRH